MAAYRSSRASDSPATYGALQMCFDWLIDWTKGLWSLWWRWTICGVSWPRLCSGNLGRGASRPSWWVDCRFQLLDPEVGPIARLRLQQTEKPSDMQMQAVRDFKGAPRPVGALGSCRWGVVSAMERQAREAWCAPATVACQSTPGLYAACPHWYVWRSLGFTAHFGSYTAASLLAWLAQRCTAVLQATSELQQLFPWPVSKNRTTPANALWCSSRKASYWRHGAAPTQPTRLCVHSDLRGPIREMGRSICGPK